MARLTDAQQMFLIDRLACYISPSEVAKEFEAMFGAPIAPSTLLRYDPTTVQGKKELADNWKELFEERRKRFIEDTSSIPITSAAYRLQMLQQLFETNRTRSPVIAMNLLEQAAKEAGGAFTNKRDVTSKGEAVGIIGIEILPPAGAENLETE